MIIVEIKCIDGHYVAIVDGGMEYIGASPDEALGYAVRESLLANANDTITVKLKL